MKRLINVIIAVTSILAFSAIPVYAAGPKETGATLPDFDSLWDYDDPAGTRVKFEEILPVAKKAGDQSYYLQLLTQIARTWSLASGFEQAHAILDTVESSLATAPKIVEVRYLLERGRTFRSSGKPETALPLFLEAYAVSTGIRADFYAIDAAHMIAIADTSWDERMKWNQIGVKLAEGSSDERARGWLGSLYNNVGWDCYDRGEYDEALAMFDKALAVRQQQGKPKGIGIAKWCVARVLRSLARTNEALSIQSALLAEYDSTGQADGYVHEELGELYLTKGDTLKSQGHFAKAFDLLSKDPLLAEHEAARLKRMKELGRVE